MPTRFVPEGYQHGVVYRDLTSAVSSAKVPTAKYPTSEDFGPTHTPQRQELKFAVDDYVFMEPFHINHDIKPLGSKAFIHVHWSTNGTDNGKVQWECTILRALGHNQDVAEGHFGGTPVVKTVEQRASGTAWQHMIAEVPDGEEITLTEPDEIIFVTLRRIAASTDECTADVFGLTVGFHYEADRVGTPQRAPNFYERKR